MLVFNTHNFCLVYYYLNATHSPEHETANRKSIHVVIQHKQASKHIFYQAQVYSNVYHVHLLCLFNNGEDDGKERKTKHIMWLLHVDIRECVCVNVWKKKY